MGSDIGVEAEDVRRGSVLPAAEAMSRQGFKDLMSGFPTGVAVVTTLGRRGEPMGFTCSSLCAVSLDPPLLLVCVTTASRTLTAIEKLGVFAVNLLHDRARHTAELFSADIDDRFSFVRWQPTSWSGLPHLAEDAHGIAVCAVDSTRAVGDHTIVIGRVWEIALRPTEGPPLLYGQRRYAAWPPE